VQRFIHRFIMSSRQIGVGVIGAGAMGRAYCECLRRHVHGGRLVAVAGGARAASLACDYETAHAPSVEALLTRPEVEAVIIASPETAHCEQALAAAAHGKHVLVEKPMAPNVAQCDVMIAACESARVTLMVVKHWRFRGVHTRGRAIVQAGEFGALQTVRNQTGASLASSLEIVGKKQFYLDPAGGGLLMGWAVHNLDWVCHLVGGTPLRARMVEPMRKHPMIGATHLHAELGFAGGIDAFVRVSIDLASPPPANRIFYTDVQAERGELELDGYGALRVAREGDFETRWVQPPFDPRQPVDARRLEAYAAMVESFLDAIRDGRPPPVSGQDGRRAVALFRQLCG
jgi:predicted dehydrogenase